MSYVIIFAQELLLVGKQGDLFISVKLLIPLVLHLCTILVHKGVERGLLFNLEVAVWLFSQYIDDKLFWEVGQDRVECDSGPEPELVAIVGCDRSIVCGGRERLQIELCRDSARRRQVNADSTEDEEEHDAEEERIVRPDLLSEGLRDAERNTCDQILIISHHEQNCLFVGQVRLVELQVFWVQTYVEGLLADVEEEENLEAGLNDGRYDDWHQDREVE